jgi:hypothetical protein
MRRDSTRRVPTRHLFTPQFLATRISARSATFRPSNEADALTHPTRNFHIPHSVPRDGAHAHELLGVFCDRLCDWGLAKFGSDSHEGRLLRALRALHRSYQPMRASRPVQWTLVPVATDFGMHSYGIQTSWLADVDRAAQITSLMQHSLAFRLSFEVAGSIYAVADIVQCLQSTTSVKTPRIQLVC